jgi:hypothetical protein
MVMMMVMMLLCRRVQTPFKSNACWGFDPTTGWTFFDLTSLHDEFTQPDGSASAPPPGSVIECDFYHADQLLVRRRRRMFMAVVVRRRRTRRSIVIEEEEERRKDGHSITRR